MWLATLAPGRGFCYQQCPMFCRILFLLLMVVGVLKAADSPAENMTLTAEQKLQDGDTKGAIAIYEEIVAKFPTFESIWNVRYNLGYSYYAIDEFDKAITLFRGLANE